MKKSVADKWINALRSGEYRQGFGLLHNTNNNTYCCLGVLCAIGEAKPYSTSEVVEHGFNLKNGHGYIASLDISLTHLNDFIVDGLEKFTFDEIADIIQINYKEL